MLSRIHQRLFPKRLSAKERLYLVQPQHIERREDETLLIWSEIPHWIVVDEEMHLLLKNFNGLRTCAEIIAHHATGRSQRDLLMKEIATLFDVGVLIRHEAESAAHHRATTNPPLANLAINITNRCNLDCRLCYNIDSLNRRGGQELDTREITAFLDVAREYTDRRPSLFILGGEPLLAQQKLIDVAEHAVSSSYQTVVSTNGILCSPEFIASARQLGLQVQVSIDGHTAQLNDAIRGKESFDAAVAGVRALVDGGVYTIMSMICHQGNVEHIADYYDLANSLGIQEARVIPLKCIGGALDAQVTPVPVSRIIEETLDMLRDYPQYLRLMGRDCFTILGNQCRLATKRASCGTGVQTLLLDADGSLYPCLNTNVPEFQIANIRDPDFSFSNTWTESPVLAKVRKETRVDDPNNPCYSCPVKYWCLGGCRGETYAVKGRLDSSSIFCADLRQSMIEMMWILAREPEFVRIADVACQ